MSDRPGDSLKPVAMVVNDDLVQLRVLGRHLEKMNIEAVLVDRAEKALSLLVSEGPPALIVTDLHMPGLDGWRFCRLLRSPAYVAFNAVPILVVSATFAGMNARQLSTDLGANAFLSVPVSPGDFSRTVEQVLAGEIVAFHPKVLVVEDSGVVLEQIAQAFRMHAYETHACMRGDAARVLFERCSPEIVVLDYYLPDMTGEVLLREFKKKNPLAVVVMMTVDPDTELALRWMKAGASAYLRKPFEPEYLVTLCENALHECALLHIEDLLEERTVALRRSEADFRRIYQEAPVMMHSIDEAGLFCNVNSKWEKVMGYTREEVMGKPVGMVMTESSAKRASEEVLPHFWAVGKVEEVAYQYVKKTGEVIDVLLDCVMMKDTAGKRVSLSVVRDVTARKAAERALLESRSMYRELVQNANSIILRMDLQGRVTFFNEFAQSFFGYAQEEVVGKLFGAILGVRNEADADPFAEILNELQAHPERSGSGESLHVCRDGRQAWVFWTHKGVLDDRGMLREVLSVGNDITQRKHAQEQLAEAQALLLAALNETPAGVVVVEAEGERVRLANAAALRIAFGVEEEGYALDLQVEELPWRLYHPDGTLCALQEWPLVRALREGVVTKNMEMQMGHEEEGGREEKRWILLNTAPVRREDGKIIASIAVFPDTTRLKQAYQRQQVLEKQMQQSQKLKSLGVMAGAVAHNFNNSLMSLLGYTDLALEELSEESAARKCIVAANQVARRAAELSALMLTYVGQGRDAIESVDLSQMVRDLQGLLQEEVPKSVTLKYSLKSGLPSLEADPAQLRQCILSLVTNASEAIGQERGWISIVTGERYCDVAFLEETFLHETVSAGDYVFLEVSDSGVGMDGDTKMRLFDPFFTTKFTGRGLGLAALLGIVRSHKGTVDVRSAVGEGACFRLFFPVGS